MLNHQRPLPIIIEIIEKFKLQTCQCNMHSDLGMNLIEVLGTAGPFLISWFVLSPFLGAYNRKATATLGSIPVELLPGWLVSMTGALTIRGILKGTVPPVPFIVVSLIVTFTLLSAWRCLYIVLTGGTSDDEYRKSGALEIFKLVGSLVKRW